MRLELSIVAPTRNEVENLAPLFALVEESLPGVPWELVIVDDDSPDGTAARAREMAAQDDRIRCIQRLHRRGLASACIEGFLSSSAPYLAVVDADVQHDIRKLAEMLRCLQTEAIDIVIGSRYMDGGGTGNLTRSRVRASRLATRLAQWLVGKPVTDPMSGFFMVKREYFHSVMHTLHGGGFKILLDLLLSPQGVARFREIPYIMRARQFGRSKLDGIVVWEYFTLLLAKLAGRSLPVRFLAFASVGLSGIGVQFASVLVLHGHIGISYAAALAWSILLSMTSNYFLNNALTFRDRMRRGAACFYGLFSFYAACFFGGLINFAVANTILYGDMGPTALTVEGTLWSAVPDWGWATLLGALSGAVWNYATTSTFTWR